MSTGRAPMRIAMAALFFIHSSTYPHWLQLDTLAAPLRGSRASRIPSPNRLNPRATAKIARSWDPDAGPGPVEGYRKLDCREWVGETIHCGEMTIDLRSGRVQKPGDRLEVGRHPPGVRNIYRRATAEAGETYPADG